MESDPPVVVLIDFENLILGAREALPGHDNPVPYAAIERLCRDYGDAIIRRAYADWGKFSHQQGDLALHGVDLIQLSRFGYANKNAADIRMAVDAMELLFTRPELAVFVLVTGDGDFSPLVQRLREHGKRVVGVGTEANASRRLVSVCSEYKYWATVVARTDPRARAAASVEFDVADAERLLVTTLRQLPQPALAAVLKNKMLAVDPSFDEQNYGCENFSELLATLNGTLVVTRDGTHVKVALAEGGPLPVPAPAAPVDASLRDLLRAGGTDLPEAPESRDALLTSVHDAWRTGRLARVADISEVMFDADTRYVPPRNVRVGLCQALCHHDAQVIPLSTPPHPEIRLHECGVGPYDGSDCAEWTHTAHAAWLAWMMKRLHRVPSLDEAMVATFFADAPEYGEELVTEARNALEQRRRARAHGVQAVMPEEQVA